MKNNESSKKRSSRFRISKLAPIAVGCAAFALANAGSIHGDSVIVQPSSPRWTVSQRAHLRGIVREAFAPALSGADRWSLVVLSSEGHPLYDDRGENAVTPASTQKLIVAATALTMFGPSFQYHTFMAAREFTGDSITGNLYLVGSGDPSFTSNDLQTGVQTLTDRGLQQITGGITVDTHAITGPEINPLWNPVDANEDFQSPTSAISLDQDNVQFNVIGAEPGAPALVHVVPRSTFVHFVSNVLSTHTSTPSDITVSVMRPNVFSVSGHVPTGVEKKYWVPVHGIAHYAGNVLATMLRDRGVTLDPAITLDRAPVDAAVVWEHNSQPLDVLVTEMLVESNNHFAEQLLRTIGDIGPQVVGDSSGIHTERHFLAAHAIPSTGLTLVDGSGLAHANRIAAMTLALILVKAERGDSGMSRLYYLLPQGGRQGTLKHYHFTSALGRVRAKSGHLDDVSALAGYVNTYHHGRLVFAFLVNGSLGDPDAAIVSALNRIATL